MSLKKTALQNNDIGLICNVRLLYDFCTDSIGGTIKQMTDKKVVERILNFSDCECLGEIHQVIQEKLDLPRWYGDNLDALWDALTGIMYVPANIKIIYKPEKKISTELSREVYKIVEVFKEAAKEYNEFVLSVDM